MGDDNMSPMPPRDMGRKVYLWAQNLLGPSKDPGPKTYLNT
jgi:hypothetical protein